MAEPTAADPRGPGPEPPHDGGAAVRGRWSGAWPVFAVMALHLLLGLSSFLTAVHTGGDNAAYLSLATSLVEEGRYVELWHPGTPPHTKYPPAYPLVLAAAMVLGVKTFTAFKLLSLAFTTAATGFCYLWLRRLHSVPFALGAASLFGASSAVLNASHWILSDPMFLALTLGAFWLISPRLDPRAGPETWDRELVSSRRVWAGMAMVLAAYFTRSAGLPLVLAVAVWLIRRRRFRPLAIYGLVFAVPALFWWLRDARTGHDYVSEFWMVNPYAPDLGQIGPGGLLLRVADNLWQYVTEYMPEGLTGLGGTTGLALGVALGALAVYGWARRMRHHAGVPEWFALIYSALILVWPAVWSGDRFALPLFPLALVYAGEGLAVLVDTFLEGRERWFLAGAGSLLAVLMGLSWFGKVGPSHECRERVDVAGPWGCYGQNVRDFAATAHWAGEHLDPEAVVASRKPRLFYLMSGRRSVTYPFTTDGVALLRQADSLGVSYVVRDNWDRATRAYVDPALARHPERFCVAAALGGAGGQPTYVMAFTDPPSTGGAEAGDDAAPPDATDAAEAAEDQGPAIADCRHEGASTPPDPARLRSTEVPLLSMDRRRASP
ncbi:MAG: hypothetical protein HKO53_01475 [Gemmatimonadetes bacterium]|nr:hypothetical protein [Gemmatimonadota bacterium]